MSFLTPWFLLGAAAIAGPILFHLIRQSVRERMPFSSLMFLRPTTQRVTRRRKLEDLWLLFLRCLCLVLLAMGFARPFFANNYVPPVSAPEGRQLILLLDSSASMKREGVWDQARGLADKYLAQAARAIKLRCSRLTGSLTRWSISRNGPRGRWINARHSPGSGWPPFLRAGWERNSGWL